MNHGAVVEAATTQIRGAFPELRLKTVTVIGQGWDSTAFLVDDEIVFRLPNAGGRAALQERTRTEVDLLVHLRGRLAVATPDPVYIAPDLGFFGYRYLPGDSLEDRPDLYASSTYLTQFARLWADVVIAVENLVSVDTAATLRLQPFPGVQTRLERVLLTRDSGVLPDPVIELAEQAVREYELVYERAASARAIAMHGDLGLSHWLVRDGDMPYAVFDWSDACIAPVEHELATLLWIPKRGAEYVDEAAVCYCNETGHQPDRRLVDLDHWANALSDVGAMLKSGAHATDPRVVGVLAHLEALAAA